MPTGRNASRRYFLNAKLELHTGAPAISGTAQVGETLTAGTSGIADADGLDNTTYRYQWLADGADTTGATGQSYTLTDSDEGKAIKVRVSFTDDAGNAESLTSLATATVAARPLGLDDFDAGDGQTVLVSVLVQVGNRGRKNYYARTAPGTARRPLPGTPPACCGKGRLRGTA